VKRFISCAKVMAIGELFFINNTKKTFANPKLIHPKAKRPIVLKA
jgi:hypothetical protein